MQCDLLCKKAQDHVDLKDELACDSVTPEAVNFQYVS